MIVHLLVTFFSFWMLVPAFLARRSHPINHTGMLAFIDLCRSSVPKTGRNQLWTREEKCCSGGGAVKFKSMHFCINFNLAVGKKRWERGDFLYKRFYSPNIVNQMQHQETADLFTHALMQRRSWKKWKRSTISLSQFVSCNFRELCL